MSVSSVNGTRGYWTPLTAGQAGGSMSAVVTGPMAVAAVCRLLTGGLILSAGWDGRYFSKSSAATYTLTEVSDGIPESSISYPVSFSGTFRAPHTNAVLVVESLAV